MKLVQAFIIIAFIFSCNKTNPASRPTSLRIIVTDSNGNFLQGASVKLFYGISDFYYGCCQIGKTVVTDENGSALFDSLQPEKYAFYAEKGCLNNQPPYLSFQNPGYSDKSLDTTKTALTAHIENRYTTALLAMGSLKYVNYTTDTFSYTWLIAGNTVVPNLTFLDVVTPGDSLVFYYEPAGVYKTQITQVGGPYNSIRVDTLHCGESLTIHLP